MRRRHGRLSRLRQCAYVVPWTPCSKHVSTFTNAWMLRMMTSER